MIIKGNSRGGASQLGKHLQRTDTNETINLLELNSPIQDVTETLRDWQFIASGTLGKKGLYHASINPDHHTLTKEQWLHSVDVLEKELGFKGQPRLIILHQKPDEDGIDREHIHVVWQRTNIETMTLKTDSKNYAAHERASLALEMEFGHERVLGKHAKRDRQQQPDFPRAETSHEDWQIAERTGISPKQRREQLQALKQTADNAQSFKNALEEAGYTLAKGDRGYTLVDENGDHFNLAKQLKIKIEEVDKFMKAIPLDSLPELEEAKKQAKQKLSETPKPQDHTPSQSYKPTPEQIAKIEEALKERHEREGRELAFRQQQELKRIKQQADEDRAAKLEALREIQKAERDKLYSTAPEHSDAWVKRFIQVLKNRWNPAEVERQKQEQERIKQELRDRQRIDRQTMIETLKIKRDQELDDLKAKHEQKQHQHADRYQSDLKRYIEEAELSNRLLEKLEEQRRQEELNRKPDEPDPPSL